MTTSEAQPFSRRNCTAKTGLKANRTCGALMMEMIPVMARVANQTTMTGPNAHATRSLPFRWKRKSPIAMAAAIRRRVNPLVSSNPGIRRMPSTAERMLIAGVMTPSPIKSAIPTSVRTDTADVAIPGFNRESRMVRRTMVPPSPLSERDMASQIYWNVMMMRRVHVMRERRPKMLWAVGSRKSRIAPMV